MRNSDVDWIGEIPEDWEVSRARYLGTVKNGLTYSPENIVDKPFGTLVLRSGNIQNGKISLANNVYVDSKINESIMIRKGDILITSRNGSPRLIGKNAIIEDELNATYGAFMMVFRSNDKVFPKYFYYMLDSAFDYYRTFFTTSTINQLTANIFNDMQFAFPSDLTEQKAIADYLDEQTRCFDQARELMTREIVALRAYRRSLIYETVTRGLDPTAPRKPSGVDWIGDVPVGWEVKPIKYIFETIGSGTTPKSDSPEFYDGEYNWIQSGDLYQTDEVVKTAKTLTESGQKSSSALTTYEAPFIAVAMYGASIGNLAISKIDASVNQAVAVLKDNEAKVRYGKYALSASKAELINEGLGGTQPNISQILLKSWHLPQPNLKEQKQIADYLDEKMNKIDVIIKIKEQQSTNLSEQRKTLIYEVVTGKKKI